jgi:hypothetical protein
MIAMTMLTIETPRNIFDRAGFESLAIKNSRIEAPPAAIKIKINQLSPCP